MYAKGMSTIANVILEQNNPETLETKVENTGSGNALAGVASAGNTLNGVFGQSSNQNGVFGQSSNPGASGVYGESSGGGYGVAGRTGGALGSKPAVYGQHTGDGDGVFGSTASPDANGIEGENTGGGFAITGRTNSSTSAAIYGDQRGTAAGVQGDSPLGVGVAGSGGTMGVQGFSPVGIGVRGQTSSGLAGVYGNGPTAGVYGIGTRNAVWGVGIGAGSGVFGVATSSTVGAWGIKGSGSANPPGGAGLFSGLVQVNGVLVKNGGGFKIDHPLDLENKYLCHSFVESPDMMNVYNGNVTTDDGGDATIVLPDYFEALNRDFRYQLTVIGQFAQAIVASKIEDNRFIIKTDRPNVEVSWQVTGIRKDAWADAHRLPVEEEKFDDHKGKYLSPEEHGKPESAGVYYALMHLPPDLLQEGAEPPV
jgi:hypothetical protein